MEIEFSPSQLPPPGQNGPVVRPGTTSAPAETPTFQGLGDLQSKLNDLALTRPDKVANAQAALSGGSKYPPDWLLDRIASLLAIHLKN